MSVVLSPTHISAVEMIYTHDRIGTHVTARTDPAPFSALERLYVWYGKQARI